ncbi:TRP-domain-containing protein, partial [Aaosphaeria arxii CBS 175.79]
FPILLLLLSFIGTVYAENPEGFVTATVDGERVLVKDDRRPSIYTGDYASCMSGGSFEVTRFDAAYYKDNMTVMFHLGGSSKLNNESIMMFIGVYAYGESRFDLTFNPCSANIYRYDISSQRPIACPVMNDIPIEAQGIIPISEADASVIPEIALSIPDFEGEAVLRIFANSTQEEIGCYTAVLRNGNTFSHPEAVGPVLGVFTFIAVISSFATAIYGDSVPEMRKHYAHSLSVLVVFAVWHHIFFSGALSVSWPSVLVAFWNNYAWAGGMIYIDSMQSTIARFIGSNKGNTMAVSAAGQNIDLGQGIDIKKIYWKRSALSKPLNIPGLYRRSKYNTVARRFEQALAARDAANVSSSSSPFSWYGNPAREGLPLPGNYSGFAGTLAQQDIPASNAFMTGFLWFLVLLAAVVFSVVAFKFLLEALIKIKGIRRDRLVYFRTHWLGYTALAALRTLFIVFFTIMFLCLFQFTYLDTTGPVAIAAVVFLVMLFGLGGLAGYACFHRIKVGRYVSEPDRINVEKRKILKGIPWYGFSRASKHHRSESGTYIGSMPWWTIHPASDAEKSVHDDEDFTKRFGWLASRFRRTRWWFFVVWLVYEFIRACFLAGASGNAMIQVFGLLAVEFIAFVTIVIMRPFEGMRLNILVVYCLGFSKVATVALSATFDTRFNLPRIPATAIGIVIIVIQGILTVVTMIAIFVGAISSWMSVKRDRDSETFRPRKWKGMREKYFRSMDTKALDVPPPPPPPPAIPEPPRDPYFNVNSFRRMAKIEDEDAEFKMEIQGGDPNASTMSFSTEQYGVGEKHSSPSRAASIRSQVSYTSLPAGARVHRASWSSRDFNE